jgi:hypothetical protein
MVHRTNKYYMTYITYTHTHTHTHKFYLRHFGMGWICNEIWWKSFDAICRLWSFATVHVYLYLKSNGTDYSGSFVFRCCPTLCVTLRNILLFTLSDQWPLAQLPNLTSMPLSTVHCPLSTAHCPLSAVRFSLSAVHCPLSAVHCPLSTAHCPLSAFHCPLPTVHCPLSTVRYRQFSIFSASFHIWKPCPSSANWGCVMPWRQGRPT